MDLTSDKIPKNGASSRDKRARFIALAEKRTINAIRAIRIIGKLANRTNYEYSEADVKKIIQALTKEIESIKGRMLQKNVKNDVEFKL